MRRQARRWLTQSSYALQEIAFLVERLVRRPRSAAARQDGRRHILIVDDLLPDPVFGAGYPRAFAIVRSLVAAGNVVEHYPMAATQSECDRMDAAFGGAVRFHPGRGAHGLRRLLWREGSRFDVLFISRPAPMAAMLAAHWRPNGQHVPIVYDAEAVLAPRDQRRLALLGTPWSGSQYQAALAAELDLARTAQAVTAVGQGDADLIRSVLDVPVFVLPHAVDVREAVPGPAGREDLLFVGRLTGLAAHSPNVDSLLWFITEVMPQLDRMLGTSYKLHVSGRLDAAELAALASDRILFHGVVEDLQPLYEQCRLFVAPTRYAAGIPLKVLEAMGEGIPCVATPLLAAQLGADATTLATGTDAETFAAQCARLYRDDAAWLDAQAAGFVYVEGRGSPEAFDRTLASLIDHVERIPDAGAEVVRGGQAM
ncbi:glycosyltransferase [Sphingomonas sp. M1-B02]|uniref:glycosyltransferase n=1 Tax=Sphingomonas sp. M1-B02 TaxID=3114300 RepID=UPI00223EA02A|nr:glycosyltransferase [Sphingomonas sp. S6-11]UZK65059.1 glycosyltransferase family 4 protein [Sphingomonas sp. S6-11]